MSSIHGLSTKLTPIYPSSSSATPEESPATQSLISSLNLQKHIEGGYFAELDRNPLLIPNPFLQSDNGEEEVKRTAQKPLSGDDAVRNASTSIYYMLSRGEPQGNFHRNKGRTVRWFPLLFFFLFFFYIALHFFLTSTRPRAPAHFAKFHRRKLKKNSSSE